MRAHLAAFVAIGVVVLPSEALACRTVYSSNVVITSKKPEEVPPGYSIFKVRFLGASRTDGGLERASVRVLRGRFRGRTFLVEPMIWTVCTGWVESGDKGYLVGKISPDGTMIEPTLQYPYREEEPLPR